MAEEKTRQLASRSWYKGHVTRLFHKIDELMSGDFDDYTVASLSNAIEQLTKKMDKIAKIDERLLELLDDATEIESTVLEAEELNDDITDKIARGKRFTDLHGSKRIGRESPPIELSPLTSESSEVSQPQELGNPSSSEPQASSSSPPHSTSAPLMDSVAESSASVSTLPTPALHISVPSVSIPEVIVSDSIMPPPLIPVHKPPSHIVQQTPVISSVPDPRSLYAPSVSHLETFPISVGY